MDNWLTLESIGAIVDLATDAGPSSPAVRISFSAKDYRLPELPLSQGVEVIEALFLEDRAPIAVFGFDRAEVLVLRILESLWGGLRSSFSTSTFCRSPRTIGKRSFDLVFAPVDARSKFADWQGRRIDGTRKSQSRHPWSQEISERILLSPTPSLRDLDAFGEMAFGNQAGEAALRVSLLWNDLLKKVPTAPNAALGLLDIVNTRSVRQTDGIRKIEPQLLFAIEAAVKTFSPRDAWQFVHALQRKLGKEQLTLLSREEVGSNVVYLVTASPTEALEFYSSLAEIDSRSFFSKLIARGLSQVVSEDVLKSLRILEPTVLFEILFADEALRHILISSQPSFCPILADALLQASPKEIEKCNETIQPLLVEDWQLDPFEILLSHASAEQTLAVARNLYEANDLSASALRAAVHDHVILLHAEEVVREGIAVLEPKAGADLLVESLLQATGNDVEWIISSSTLIDSRKVKFLNSVLERAPDGAISSLFAQLPIMEKAIGLLMSSDSGERNLVRIVENAKAWGGSYFAAVQYLLNSLGQNYLPSFAGRILESVLHGATLYVDTNLVNKVVGAIGANLDARRVFQLALHRSVSSEVASRNLIALNSADFTARTKLLMAVQDLSYALTSRYKFDITLPGSEAVASIIWDARDVAYDSFLRAAANLLPFILDEKELPASPVMAAVFPPVYIELSKSISYDFLSFIFIFLDWDKCKSARQRLVDAFFHSDWRISDIAIAAVRAEDAIRILGRIADERGGRKLLQGLKREVFKLPTVYQDQVLKTLSRLDV